MEMNLTLTLYRSSQPSTGTRALPTLASTLTFMLAPFDDAKGLESGDTYAGQPDNPSGCPWVLLLYGLEGGYAKIGIECCSFA